MGIVAALNQKSGAFSWRHGLVVSRDPVNTECCRKSGYTRPLSTISKLNIGKMPFENHKILDVKPAFGLNIRTCFGSQIRSL